MYRDYENYFEDFVIPSVAVTSIVDIVQRVDAATSQKKKSEQRHGQQKDILRFPKKRHPVERVFGTEAFSALSTKNPLENLLLSSFRTLTHGTVYDLTKALYHMEEIAVTALILAEKYKETERVKKERTNENNEKQ